MACRGGGGGQRARGLQPNRTNQPSSPHSNPPLSPLKPRLYNLDVFEYLDESPFGLYGSIPFMLAHQPGLTVGAFW